MAVIARFFAPKDDGAPEMEPKWLKQARKYIGTKEIPGARDNKDIVRWWQLIGATWFDDDETPWCGGFVGGMLAETGYPVVGGGLGASARKWLTYGHKLSSPKIGCIVVFWRGSPASSSGHVGFVIGKDKSGRLMVLGGNQSDAVNIKPFSTGQVLGYRWPPEAPTPKGSLPIL